MLEELSNRLIEGGYTADTPAAIVLQGYLGKMRKTAVCTVGTLAEDCEKREYHEDCTDDHWGCGDTQSLSAL